MLALIDRKAFRYSVLKRGVVIFEAGFQLFQRDLVGPVPVDFIGGHMNEWGFRTGPPGRFQHMQCAQGIHLKVEEWNRGCAVMGWLRGGVDDQMGTQLVDKSQQLISLADVQGSMLIARDFAPQPVQYPTCIALRSEKDGAMIAVNSVDLKTVAPEEARNLGTNQHT